MNCLEGNTMSNPVHTSENEDVRGVSLQSFICLEGSTSQEIMRESQSGTAFQAGRDGGISLSEGILSFVEYAPRLLIVLPSRQF